MHFEIAHTPCHTKGSSCLILNEPDIGTKIPIGIFVGDTIFLGGCGRFFEGLAEDFVKIADRLFKILPKGAYVFPGHDYIRQNLQFAAETLPNHLEIQTRLVCCQDSKDTICWALWAEELKTNIFLMAALGLLGDHFGGSDSMNIVSKLRHRKDMWKP